MINKEFIEHNFSKGKLTIIGSRPAMGKTSLITSIAVSLANNGYNSIFFSAEMSEIHLIKRIKLQIGEEQYDKIYGMIYIDDTPSVRLSEIRKRLEQLSVDYIFFDYIQLLNGETENGRTEEIAHIIQTLKQIAKEFNLAIIATSQLRRSTFVRYGNGTGELPSDYGCRPNMQYLNIPVEVLNDVNIFFIHRPDYYKNYEYYNSGKRIEGKVEFIKYRDSDMTITPLYFNSQTTDFSEWLNWERIKEEILNTNNWLINLDRTDIEYFEEDNPECIKVVEASTCDTSEDRFERLIDSLKSKICELTPCTNKMLVIIQAPVSAPITMCEIESGKKLLELYPNKDDYKDIIIWWGVTTRNDTTTRILCAIQHYK